VPEVERQEPLHLQVSGFFKSQILSGEKHEGDRLPSVREIRDQWQVGQNVAQRAIEHLKTEGLVRTDATGTYVAAPRAAYGPQQRLRLSAAPAGETQEVLSARLRAMPDYIRPILGEANGVIRREWVTRENGRPARLSVSWCLPSALQSVPELLDAAPLPDPRGAAAMLTERAGRSVQDLAGRTGFECRAAKDDGRELVHLGLQPGAYVLAGVYTWRTGDDVLEYGEYILPPGRVIESDMEP
jgi:GntR family transcriptional regulator